MKRGELSMEVIIIAAIALLVLVILAVLIIRSGVLIGNHQPTEEQSPLQKADAACSSRNMTYRAMDTLLTTYSCVDDNREVHTFEVK